MLLVDDDGECREMFRAILEAAGAEVTAAASGREAVAALRLGPDAIVSDLAMSDGDGYWLIRQVRALGGEAQRIPAVAVTAYGQRRYRERALAEGFSEYLEKPVDPDALCRLLADLVRSGAPRWPPIAPLPAQKRPGEAGALLDPHS